MKNKIFEIAVDKNNEKWPWVFEHILIILHKAYEDYNRKFFKKKEIQNSFSLEISKIWNKIRFFIVSPPKYANFLKNQIYAHYSDVEIFEISDYMDKVPVEKIIVWQIGLSKHFLYSIKTFTELQWDSSNDTIDPYSSITSSLWRIWNYSLNSIQINFNPIENNFRKKWVNKKVKILTSNYPSFLKNILLDPKFVYIKIFFLPIIFMYNLFWLIFSNNEKNEAEEKEHNDEKEKKVEKDLSIDDKKLEEMPLKFINKISSPGFKVSINVIHAWDDIMEWKMSIKEIASTLWVFANFSWNSFRMKKISNDEEIVNIVKTRKINEKYGFVLNASELSGLVHLPTNYVKTPQINWVIAKSFEPPWNLPILCTNENLTPIWKTNFRWTNIDFWILPSDRRRHMYIVWKTWMWKSTLLENMIIDDIFKWRGVAVIDPHWDLAEWIIWHIPSHRTNQTIIFDPSDTNWPIAFNMLDWVKPEHKSFVASWLVWIFKKIFWESWWPRLEHTLRNIILALLEYPWSTLISIPLMLTSETFRHKVVNKLKDPVVKNFWTQEFAKMSPTQKIEAAWPILNKVWQFLSSTILRNVLWQNKNSFSVRWAMDNKRIIIINLSKWKIWEDASALLWAMMVTKFQMDAMSRADILEKDRSDFYLYVDEFQNFATDSFATILSEARKYKLNLVMANQYIEQMTEDVRWAVFWNVWSLISFQVWINDAKLLKEVFSNDIKEEDLMNLKKYNIYSKILVDWMPTNVFSASTFFPKEKDEILFKERYSKILAVSREKYCKSRSSVEAKINSTLDEVEREEKDFEKKKEDFKKKKEAEKKAKN